MISILTDLIVFIFAFALKSMTIEHDQSPNLPSVRPLPEGAPSEFYRLQTILSPHGEHLLHHYDQCAMNGEFPFPEQIQNDLDNL